MKNKKINGLSRLLLACVVGYGLTSCGPVRFSTASGVQPGSPDAPGAPHTPDFPNIPGGTPGDTPGTTPGDTHNDIPTDHPTDHPSDQPSPPNDPPNDGGSATCAPSDLPTLRSLPPGGPLDSDKVVNMSPLFPFLDSVAPQSDGSTDNSSCNEQLAYFTDLVGYDDAGLIVEPYCEQTPGGMYNLRLRLKTRPGTMVQSGEHIRFASQHYLAYFTPHWSPENCSARTTQINSIIGVGSTPLTLTGSCEQHPHCPDRARFVLTITVH